MELLLLALGGLALFLLYESSSQSAPALEGTSTEPPTSRVDEGTAETHPSTEPPTTAPPVAEPPSIEPVPVPPAPSSSEEGLTPAFTFDASSSYNILKLANKTSAASTPSTSPPSTSPPAPPPPVTTPPDVSTGVMQTLIAYNITGINNYRAKKGIPPVVEDKKLDEYALAGSTQLSVDHKPHAHIEHDVKAGTIAMYGFSGGGAENQGDPNGIFSFSDDMLSNGKQQIDWALATMYAEGPGGGHYNNMMNGAFRRVGIGLLFVGSKLYMTNDFST